MVDILDMKECKSPMKCPFCYGQEMCYYCGEYEVYFPIDEEWMQRCKACADTLTETWLHNLDRQEGKTYRMWNVDMDVMGYENVGATKI